MAEEARQSSRFVFLSPSATRHLGAALAECVLAGAGEDLARRVYEFLDPGETGMAILDASADIEQLDRCYKHKFFRVCARYVSVCGICPPVLLPSLRCWKTLKRHFLTFPENYEFLCLYSDGFGKMYTSDGHVYVGPDFEKIVPTDLLPERYKKLYMYRDWCVAVGEVMTLIHVPLRRVAAATSRLDEIGLCSISAAPTVHGMFGLCQEAATLEFVEILFLTKVAAAKMAAAVPFPEILDQLAASWSESHSPPRQSLELVLQSREEISAPVPHSQNLEYRIVGGLKYSIRVKNGKADEAECGILDEQSFVIDDDIFLLNKKQRVIFTNKFLE